MSNTEISTHSRYTAPTQGLFSLSWPIFIDLAMHYLTVTINIYMVSMISLQAVAELNVGSQAFSWLLPYSISSTLVSVSAVHRH